MTYHEMTHTLTYSSSYNNFTSNARRMAYMTDLTCMMRQRKRGDHYQRGVFNSKNISRRRTSFHHHHPARISLLAWLAFLSSSGYCIWNIWYSRETITNLPFPCGLSFPLNVRPTYYTISYHAPLLYSLNSFTLAQGNVRGQVTHHIPEPLL